MSVSVEDKKKIKLSIIIPFFNSFSYIKELINTIKYNKNVEVLIIDDKSSENESNKLKEYLLKFPYIKYFYNNGIKSAGTCRNIGLKNASGDWIVFADSDDLFVNDFYIKLKKYFDSKYDVIYFKPTSLVRKTGAMGKRHLKYEQVLEKCLNSPTNEDIIKLKTTFVVPWSKLYRREYIISKKIEFDAVLASNDVMFSLKSAFFTDKLFYSDEVIYCVVKNDDSLMYKIGRENLDARLDVYIRQYHFLKAQLSKKDFKKLNMRGTSIIKRYINAKQPIHVILYVSLKLLLNGIKIFDFQNMNPFSWKSRINETKKNYEEYK